MSLLTRIIFQRQKFLLYPFFVIVVGCASALEIGKYSGDTYPEANQKTIYSYNEYDDYGYEDEDEEEDEGKRENKRKYYLDTTEFTELGYVEIGSFEISTNDNDKEQKDVMNTAENLAKKHGGHLFTYRKVYSEIVNTGYSTDYSGTTYVGRGRGGYVSGKNSVYANYSFDVYRCMKKSEPCEIPKGKYGRY